MEQKMKNIGCEFTSVPLSNSMNEQRHYPAHDSQLSELCSAMINQLPVTNSSIEGYHNPLSPYTLEVSEILPDSKTAGEGDEQALPKIPYLTQLPGSIINREGDEQLLLDTEYSARINAREVTNNIIEGFHIPHSPLVESTISINEMLPESITTGEGDEQLLLETEFESPGSQIEAEFTTSNDLESNTSVQTIDGQHTTWLHHFADPKKAAFLLLVYLGFLGTILWKHNPTDSLLIILSVAAFAMAFMVLCFWFWIYDQLYNPNSSHQMLYHGRYKKLKAAYCVLCGIAVALLCPVIIAKTST